MADEVKKCCPTARAGVVVSLVPSRVRRTAGGGRRRARPPAACVRKGGRERGSGRMPTPRGGQRPQKGLLFIFVDSWGKVLNIFSMLRNNKFPPLLYPLIAGLMGRSSLSSLSSSLPPAADGAAADGRRTATRTSTRGLRTKRGKGARKWQDADAAGGRDERPPPARPPPA